MNSKYFLTDDLHLTLGRPPFNFDSEWRLWVSGLLAAKRWCHIALVTGPGGAKVYFNGQLVATSDYGGSLGLMGSGGHYYLGKSNWPNDRPLDGEMDEVRVWVTEGMDGVSSTIRGKTAWATT